MSVRCILCLAASFHDLVCMVRSDMQRCIDSSSCSYQAGPVSIMVVRVKTLCRICVVSDNTGASARKKI